MAKRRRRPGWLRRRWQDATRARRLPTAAGRPPCASAAAARRDFQLDDFAAIAHGLEQCAEAQVSGLAQAAFGRADDETERASSMMGASILPALLRRWASSMSLRSQRTSSAALQ